jgi:hypothetical protein
MAGNYCFRIGFWDDWKGKDKAKETAMSETGFDDL